MTAHASRWRSSPALRPLATTFLLLSALASAAAPAEETGWAANGVAIAVAPGNWGSAETRDIQRVLESVASEFPPSAGPATGNALNIRVIPRNGSPRVLYERGPNGEYVVQLTARDQRWFQYAYQFAHELCHIASNFDHKDRTGGEVATTNQWFEESVCETASLFTLKRLALSWTDTPPARKWMGYAPVFANYATHLLAQTHRQLPATQSLAQWYEENRTALSQSPYLREKNELVATQLLPLFERNPESWRTLAFLNADTASAAKPFPAYLSDWDAATPLEDKPLARQTMALFGFTPATQLTAAASPASDDSAHRHSR